MTARIVACLLLCLLTTSCNRTSSSKSPPSTAPGISTLTAAGYAAPNSCAACHAEIYRKYQQTGMGRSFAAVRKEKLFEDLASKPSFYHRASNRHYTMFEREGKYFQRRHQLAPDGAITNVVEKEIHFVMGSGNHVRTYLHRTPQGALIQLPLAWYAERGGHWAMNPGYDRLNHPGFRRTIPDDCMFCHNGYPDLSSSSRSHGASETFPAKLPEGIDCQRCHGPGQSHIQAATAAKAKDEIRRLIYNPSTQSPQRQLELCMQCHLESTSRALPYSIVRFDREPYSYRPSEPLANYILHFDYPPGKAPNDHFEIAHAAYRLRQSACFNKSNGGLVCTTCHDPHEAKRGPAAAQHYTAVCRGCHEKAHPGESRATGCAACHMPKRRTDDVVHAVMTDHLIRRRQPRRDLLAPLAEKHDTEATAYRGEVAPYYPPTLPPGPDKDLYEATAQVYAAANLQAGIPRLEQAIQRHTPAQPEFYHHLAEAYFRTGKDEPAASWYRRALERDPAYLPAIRNLGATLTRMGRYAESADVLRRAPHDSAALTNLGEALLGLNQPAAAVDALRRALTTDPDSPEALNNLGRALAASGNAAAATESWLSAIRIKPDFARAHGNLANHLNAAGRWDEALRHFEAAIRDSTDALARYNYGSALAQRGALDRAERLLADAVRLDPNLAGAHLNLGNIHAMRGQPAKAIVHFESALHANPAFGQARLNLGVALAELGRTPEAIAQLRAAAQHPDPEVRRLAESALQQLATPP